MQAAGCNLLPYPLGRQGAVVAVIQGEVVGMAATTPSVDLDMLRSNFRLEQGLSAGCCHVAQEHAELDVCVMNPVFAKTVGALLSGGYFRP